MSEIRRLPDFNGKTVEGCDGCPFSGGVDKFETEYCTLIDQYDTLVSIPLPYDKDDKPRKIFDVRCPLDKIVDGKVVQTIRACVKGSCQKCGRLIVEKTFDEGVVLAEKHWCDKCSEDVEPRWCRSNYGSDYMPDEIAEQKRRNNE